MTERLQPGDLAPDFTLSDDHGDAVTLSQLRGQRVILYFYPQAFTPGCTTQACDFRDSSAPLQAAGYTVLGVSRDSVEKLASFRDDEKLPFPLLSDPDHAVHEAYTAWGEKQNYGKTITGVLRSTFVIDADGKVEQTFYNTKATGHVAMLRKKLGLAAA
ncbi:thioredoxin-dependent thiol peroxidase [Schumannella sp. 10F1B-5-1]|uniref:thioredoxin-dependent thiol peroxidase n=1 Tax=Schumannella sp. 10F1B-5-1 TaxID=2590780 RepID=UPI0011326317|nr:thioredoxin-dependent thiol peroxidase [Schumannella sp. 10F1B-5-1]TPW73601.1 thioredoxin-dependent thiol peroxidase [Schumannella sp. 10F1B-5-1]